MNIVERPKLTSHTLIIETCIHYTQRHIAETHTHTCIQYVQYTHTGTEMSFNFFSTKSLCFLMAVVSLFAFKRLGDELVGDMCSMMSYGISYLCIWIYMVTRNKLDSYSGLELPFG